MSGLVRYKYVAGRQDCEEYDGPTIGSRGVELLVLRYVQPFVRSQFHGIVLIVIKVFSTVHVPC